MIVERVHARAAVPDLERDAPAAYVTGAASSEKSSMSHDVTVAAGRFTVASVRTLQHAPARIDTTPRTATGAVGASCRTNALAAASACMKAAHALIPRGARTWRAHRCCGSPSPAASGSRGPLSEVADTGTGRRYRRSRRRGAGPSGEAATIRHVTPTARPDGRERIFLLDGHSLAYRAYFALPSTLATSTGQVTNAVTGSPRC